MNIFISHTSSYDFWLYNDLPQGASLSRARPQPGNRLRKQDTDKLSLSAFNIREQLIHITVASSADRSQLQNLACHLWSGASVSGAFICIAPGVYVSSPETSFIQMAVELSPIELIMYGYFLCSSFAYSPVNHDIRKRDPLTTIEKLKKQVEKAAGMHGVKQAARALAHIANKSASPMETNLTIALCAPRRLGGYGIQLPELNVRIEANETTSLLERNYFECDLYWRRHRIAVEYDSKKHHGDDTAKTKDSSRRSGLLMRDILVISVTTSQYADARRFDETARAIAKSIGQRLPANDASWMMRRYRLRQTLLQGLPLPPMP